MTMICKTSDGPVTISRHAVSLADYHLQFEGEVADGILRFTDNRNNVSATLDTRDDQGLYLRVEDNGTKMQVVAARSEIFCRPDDGSEPSAPSLSALNRFLRSSTRNVNDQ
jgi:hypothetical protein